MTTTQTPLLRVGRSFSIDDINPKDVSMLGMGLTGVQDLIKRHSGAVELLYSSHHRFMLHHPASGILMELGIGGIVLHPDTKRNVSSEEFKEWDAEGRYTDVLACRSFSSLYCTVIYLPEEAIPSFLDYFVDGCAWIQQQHLTPKKEDDMSKYRSDPMQAQTQILQEVLRRLDQMDEKIQKLSQVHLVPQGVISTGTVTRPDFSVPTRVTGYVQNTSVVLYDGNSRIHSFPETPDFPDLQTLNCVDSIRVFMTGTKETEPLIFGRDPAGTMRFTDRDILLLLNLTQGHQYNEWAPWLLRDLWENSYANETLGSLITHITTSLLAVDDLSAAECALCQRLDIGALHSVIEWNDQRATDWFNVRTEQHEVEVPQPFTDKTLTHIVWLQYKEEK